MGLIAILIVGGSPSRVFTQNEPLARELLGGILQVKEGDFEGAVETLDAVARRLALEPARKTELVQAHLYLGVAHTALDQRQPAHDRFVAALELDRSLKLAPDRFSPKVIEAFERARRTVEARRPARSGRAGTTILAVTGGAAAVGALVLATRGGSSPSPSPTPGSLTIARARFGTPVIECPNGFRNVPIAFTILVDADNATGVPVTISSVTSTVIIVHSAIESEEGLASSLPSTAAPTSLFVGFNSTLTITSTLLCDNAFDNAPRFNEWLGRVTLNTTAGTFPLETADHLRVNVP